MTATPFTAAVGVLAAAGGLTLGLRVGFRFGREVGRTVGWGEGVEHGRRRERLDRGAER